MKAMRNILRAPIKIARRCCFAFTQHAALGTQHFFSSTRHSALSTQHFKGRRRKAAILVLTLWISVVLSLLSASMLQEVYLEMKIAKYQRHDLMAAALARAGLAVALTDLRNDLILDHALREEPTDGLNDIWARQEKRRDKLEMELNGGTYSVWVEDEAARINLNMANVRVLKAVLLEMKIDEKQAEVVAAAIADWRDPDENATAPGAGKEDEYYSDARATEEGRRWKEGDPPLYRCRNDLFSTIDELLAVHGVTPEMFYGEDPETEGIPNPMDELLERREQDSRRRSASRRPRRFGLRDVFTVEPRATAFNINTAGEIPLTVLFRTVLNDPATAKAFVQKILTARKAQGTGTGGSKEGVFKNIQEMANTTAIPPTLFAQITGLGVPVLMRSDVYRVHALGEYRGTAHRISALVSREYNIHPAESLEPLFSRGVVHARLMERFRQRHGFRREPIEQAAVRVIQWFEL